MENMSYGGNLIVWVRDLDRSINLDAMWRADRRYEAEEAREEARERDFKKNGDISVLSGEVVSWESFVEKRLDFNEWRWAVHLAESAISPTATRQQLEGELVRGLVDLGRGYAVRRYARWERLPRYDAVTASLPYGFKAILVQYLSGQGLLSGSDSHERIRSLWQIVFDAKDKIAYRRVGYIQSFIHGMAYDVLGSNGLQSLDKEATRKLLSLARLRYSVDELRFNGFSDISNLLRSYSEARDAIAVVDGYNRTSGKFIRSWSLRHLRPLTDFFPYALRNALDRGVRHSASGAALTRIVAINELALAHVEILLMRKAAYPRLKLATRDGI